VSPRPARFGRAELIAFLRELDGRLTAPGSIRLIGGAAVGLCFLPSYRTLDVDYARADREVQDAIAHLRRVAPARIVATQTGVYFVPYGYEQRLVTLDIPGLTFLSVEVPERHDLAIMKATRGIDRDLDTLSQVHAVAPFELTTLVERFQETWVTGPQRLADLGFLLLIEVLFSDRDAYRAEELLTAHRQRR